MKNSVVENASLFSVFDCMVFNAFNTNFTKNTNSKGTDMGTLSLYNIHEDIDLNSCNFEDNESFNGGGVSISGTIGSKVTF